VTRSTADIACSPSIVARRTRSTNGVPMCHSRARRQRSATAPILSQP